MTATMTSKYPEGHDAFGSIEKRRQEYREVWNTDHNAKLGKLLKAIAKVRDQLTDLANDEPEIIAKFEGCIDCYEARLLAAEINLESFVSSIESYRCEPMKGDTMAKNLDAENLRALLVKVNRARDEVREIAEHPDLERVLGATPFDQFTAHDIGCIDLPLHKIADGAAVLYSRLVSSEV